MAGPIDHIGIIAGGGGLPDEVAQEVISRGGRVHIILVEGVADLALTKYPHTIVNWAQLRKATVALRQAGLSDIIMLGASGRPTFANARPDLGFFRAIPRIVPIFSGGGDDKVLRALAELFGGEALTVRGVGDVAPNLLAGAGNLTRAKPSEADARDIAKGLELVAALGRFDIGQGAIVSGEAIEAIEGAEGTDRMLARVAKQRSDLARSGRQGVLVKRPKPGQDLRFDLPTIGPATIENAAAAGLAGIAVMAGHVLMAERLRMIETADRLGLFVLGVEPSELTARAGSPVPKLNDSEKASAILSMLATFGIGTGVAIDRGRVLSVGASEPPADVVRRAAQTRRAPRSVRGLFAADPGAAIDEIQKAASEAKFSFEKWAPSASGDKPLRVFLVAGEHSGDALGAKLMASMRAEYPGEIAFSGVGGDEMGREGFLSLFPIEDVAVMGPLNILPKLPKIVARVNQTAAAAVASRPDIAVIIDSPEFTHPIARRIRARAPSIPIVDYVSPSVWAWRPGRAKRMRPYIDLVLGLLPFEPDAHKRLGGPPCTYVGHPLVERLDEIQSANAVELKDRLGLPDGLPILLVLPGSRMSEVSRLIDDFGAAVAALFDMGKPVTVIIPAVRHVRGLIEDKTSGWRQRPVIIESTDKYAAMRLATAALAASGTVTLELALAGCPAVVAYKVDKIMQNLRFLLKVPSVVLANLVLGENVYPENLQERCTGPLLAGELAPLLSDTPERLHQLEALAKTPGKLRLPESNAAATPSVAAARAVLELVRDQVGNSRRSGPM